MLEAKHEEIIAILRKKGSYHTASEIFDDSILFDNLKQVVVASKVLRDLGYLEQKKRGDKIGYRLITESKEEDLKQVEKPRRKEIKPTVDETTMSKEVHDSLNLLELKLTEPEKGKHEYDLKIEVIDRLSALLDQSIAEVLEEIKTDIQYLKTRSEK